MKYLAERRAPRGLHDRAISAVITLVQDQRRYPPSLASIALAVDEPVEKVRALFHDDRALLVASVEQALIVLIDSCTRAVVQVDPDDPLAQFLSLGNTYLDWAYQHPAQFRLLQDCQMTNARNEPALRRYTDSITDLTVRMLARARDSGRLHPREDIAMLALSARCYVIGLARLVLDGRLVEYSPDGDSLTTAKLLTHDFVIRMARSSQPSVVSM
ncbi:TetR-like C-terminal domain-containing protein [Paracoccus sp. Ld10]|uniref:TetR-like C-terminal domain-containing protein n=1 Tax=Paracoccus sp. Ld10 TaxID=649158 RepID=UPI00386EBCC1